MNLRTLPLLLLASAGLVTAAHAQDVDVSIQIRLGHAAPPPPPEIVVVDEAGPPGPPPWAESHWFRRSYGYYYYPGCNVYYRPADRVWFFLDGNTWRFSAQLPSGIRIDFGRSVSLTLESDRPYVYHDKVVAYYPANYFAKVKFKNAHDNRPDRDHRARSRDDDEKRDKPGRGKGHGKGQDRDRDRND